MRLRSKQRLAFERKYAFQNYRIICYRKECLLKTLTSPQNGCGTSIEYYQLKAATLAREVQQVFMTAIFTLYAGKVIAQIAAIETAVNHLLDKIRRI
jgi:hypothetical protein